MLKRNGKPVAESAADQNGNTAPEPIEYRENDRINAQIDDYIKENSKHWERIKAMPRERLERTVVWQQIRYNDRKQKLDNGLLRKVEDNPELKSAYDNLLKHIPESERERARVSIARTLVLSQSRSERPKNAVAV
jgi:siroheme synthase (precorrin-2 oxidase/ferrochelatase)